MSHVKEPEGVDFLIQSHSLTEQERKEISALIKKIKSKSHCCHFSSLLPLSQLHLLHIV
jgi:hypothetical protein